MKIKSIKYNTRKADVYDFETPSHSYILGNGCVSHNTQEIYSKAVVSGGCLLAGTKIKLSDGTLKNIEDITLDDKVLTLDGEKEVTHIWNPDTLLNGTPECYEIEFEDGYKIVCSDKHKFLNNLDDPQLYENWMTAQQIFDLYCEGHEIELDFLTADYKLLKVKKVIPKGKMPVYDISVKDAEHYVLENGVVTHNTGIYYSASNIFIIGRQQEKEGTEVVGYNFVINVEKSRYVREKSKIPITVTYDGGISKYSGLLEMALESGSVVKPSNGWYSKVDTGTGEVEAKKYRLKDTTNKAFWDSILNDKIFTTWVENRYKLIGNESMIDDGIDDFDLDDVED